MIESRKGKMYGGYVGSREVHLSNNRGRHLSTYLICSLACDDYDLDVLSGGFW